MRRYKWWNRDTPTIIKSPSKSLLHEFKYEGESLGLTLNPYVGCAHRCVYCYATYEWFPEFYDKVLAKVNVTNLLSSELMQRSYTVNEPIMLSSSTDCYQPVEGRLRLTKKCVELLQRHKIPYVIITKSSTIVRDLWLHARYRDKCVIVWSLTTVDEWLKRLIEPNAPAAKSVLEAIKRFSEAGVRVGVNIDPIIPGLTDDPIALRELVKSVADAGAKFASAGMLRLRDEIWERLKSLLESEGLYDTIRVIENVYFRKPRRYAYYYLADPSYASEVLKYVEGLVKEHGIQYGFPTLGRETVCYTTVKEKAKQTLLQLT